MGGIKCERDARLLLKGRENNLGVKVGWCHFWNYGRKKGKGVGGEVGTRYRKEVGGKGCERWDVTEPQFCLLSVSSVTDCQTGAGVV